MQDIFCRECAGSCAGSKVKGASGIMKKLNRLLLSAGLFGYFLSPAFAEVEIKVSGVVEVEFGFVDNFANEKNSALALATVEIGIDAQINETVSAHILMLHQDGDTEPQEIDEGSVTIAGPDGGFYFTGGRLYVPFGVFESNMISDPLTLEIGEIREAAMQFGIDGAIYGSLFIFNGATIEAQDPESADDAIDQFGFNMGYISEFDETSFDIGMDYISSIGESAGLFGALEATTEGKVVGHIAGVAVHVNFSAGPFNIFTEYVAALDQFDVTEIAFNDAGAQPSAYNFEIGYLYGQSAIAIGFAGSAEALDAGLPESRASLVFSTEIIAGAALAVEVAVNEDYSTNDKGTDVNGTGNSASTITLHVAVEF